MDIFAGCPMGDTFYLRGNPVMVTFFRYLIIMIFFGSAIGKIMGFDDTLLYFAGLTKISFPVLTILLWTLIILELLTSFLVWKNGIQVRIIFISVQLFLITFLLTNIAFLVLGVDNCACFGAGIQSHPFVGILKTIVLMMIVYFLREGKFYPVLFKSRKMRE